MLRRKGGFTTRIHVPTALQSLVGRREVWRSTQTDNAREARLRESIWQHHFSTLFVTLLRTRRTMPKDQLATLVSDYLDARLEEVEERLVIDLPGRTEVDRDVWQNSIIEKLETIELQLIEGDYSQTNAEARAMLPAGASEVTTGVLARRLIEAQYDALRAELSTLHGKPLQRVRLVARAAEMAAPASSRKESPRVSQICSEYMQTTAVAQKWAEGTIKSRRQSVHLLTDFLDDMPIGDVTKAHMTDAYKLLPRMPVRYDKRYPTLTPKATIEAADKAGDAERYSPKSCNMRLEVWKAVFRYAVNHDTIDRSPADHLKAFAMGRAQDARDAFTDAQLIAFMHWLKRERTERPEHYWVARVMAYTGMRLEEASALRPCDVRTVDGVLCVEVSSDAGQIKTENAARFIPVHSAMRDELHHYASSRSAQPTANLWGLEADRFGKWSAALSKRLNKRLQSAIQGKSKKLVVESLRNTFATRLKAADVQEHVISELMGHAVDSLSVGRYGKKLEPEKLRANIERLVLPTL
jgi:integrase